MSRDRRDQVQLTFDEFDDLRITLLGRQVAGDDPAVGDEYQRLLDGEVRLVDLVEHWTGSVEALRNQPHRADRAGMTRQLVHVHIPKTAGTSINVHLAHHLDPERLFSQRPIREILSYSVIQLLDAPFIACHGASLLLDVLPEDRAFFTVLREPAEQLWSHFNETRRAGLTDADFEEWCADENNWNPQSRWLTMDWTCLRPHQPELHDARRLPPDRLLSEAQATLARLECVGFTHRLEGLLERLAQTAGVAGLVDGSLPSLNVTDRDRVDAVVSSSMVLRATEVDRSLIEYARGR